MITARTTNQLQDHLENQYAYLLTDNRLPAHQRQDTLLSRYLDQADDLDLE